MKSKEEYLEIKERRWLSPISLGAIFLVISILISVALGQTVLVRVMAEKAYFKSEDFMHTLADLTCYLKQTELEQNEEIYDSRFEQVDNIIYYITKVNSNGLKQFFTNDNGNANNSALLKQNSKFYFQVRFYDALNYSVDSNIEKDQSYFSESTQLFRDRLDGLIKQGSVGNIQQKKESYKNIEVSYYILEGEYLYTQDFIYENIQNYMKTARIKILLLANMGFMGVYLILVMIGARANRFKGKLLELFYKLATEIKLVGLFWLGITGNHIYWRLYYHQRAYQSLYDPFKQGLKIMLTLWLMVWILGYYIVYIFTLYKKKQWKEIKNQSWIITHPHILKIIMSEIYTIIGIDVRKSYKFKLAVYTILHILGLMVLCYGTWEYAEDIVILAAIILIGTITIIEFMHLWHYEKMIRQIQQIKGATKHFISIENLIKAILGMIAYSLCLLGLFVVSNVGFEWGIIFSIMLGIGMMLFYFRRIKRYSELYYKVTEIAAGVHNGEVINHKARNFLSPIMDELSNIDRDFKEAVKQEVISQRMKTELISNVSHDLKTPLTSIINYVDLLKKEDLTKEEFKEYVEILDKKSQRLKILIEDLFEASKTASGNIELVKEQLDIVALLKQTMGELTEKITASGLQFKVRLPEEKLYCSLDGRRTYRIFENLMSNILKYAELNSRVYIDCQTEGEQVQIIFRNISAYEMHFTAEEIMERFKRGDKSRNTEGSGLGLAIARNLTELQDGKFEIFIDGDLFKVIITFPYQK